MHHVRDSIFSIHSLCISKHTPNSSAGELIKSVRSRVTTIAEHLSYDMDVLEFRDRLLQALFGESGGKEYEISRNERREIMCLARDKYESFLWTYGKNPPADLTHGKRFGGGSITVKASLKN